MWAHTAKKDPSKLQILASLLPTSFILGITQQEMNKLIVFWNTEVKKIRGDRRNELTKNHVIQALEIRNKMIFGEEEEDEDVHDDEIIETYKTTDADVKEALEFLYANSDESPETNQWEKKEKEIKEKNLRLHHVLKSPAMQSLFGISVEVDGPTTYWKVCRRLAHIQFEQMRCDLNEKRESEGKAKLSKFLFKKCIPSFIVQPTHHDSFSCICVSCYNLSNLLGRGKTCSKNENLTVFKSCRSFEKA